MEPNEQDNITNNETIENMSADTIINIMDQISDRIKKVDKRNNKAFEQLQDTYTIYFNPVVSNFINISIKVDGVENINSDDSDEENEGIKYNDFLNNNMQIPEIKDKDEIVINMSYANIWFGFPCYCDSPTFKIKATDELKGFTREELALKIFRRFHMLYFLHKNYDMVKGVIDTEIIESKRCFQPLCGEYDYSDNGVYGIEYDKKNNRWEVLCVNIH